MEQADSKPRKKQKSAVPFIYSDLSNAIDVISVVETKGAGSCTSEQLAAWNETVPTNGTFRSKLSAARMMELIEVDKKRVSLTDLGYRALDLEPDALVEAFFNVELFKKMYEHLKGRRLPSDSALENLVVGFGVPVKQRGYARRGFVSSASFANFIDLETERLIEPKTNEPEPSEQITPTVAQQGESTSVGSDLLSRLDPTIVGLLEHIPEGDVWSEKARNDWLDVLGRFLALVYKEDEVIFNPSDVHPEKEDY